MNDHVSLEEEIEPIKDVGFYRINVNFAIAFVNKPNLFHRVFTKLLLGWEWVDYDRV